MHEANYRKKEGNIQLSSATNKIRLMVPKSVDSRECNSLQ